MKNNLFLILLFCQINTVFSQETVKIVTYGSGKTYESALSIALRSSLEQASGAFISNMAVVKNDSLIYDEVKSISNVTITKYNILAKVFDSANAVHTLTIEAEIVPEKFVSFAKSINNSIEFNGNAFIQNIKLNRLYKKNEVSILLQYLSQYFQVVDTSYANLNALYMEGWHKLFNKDVKVVGSEPFKYNHKPMDIWQLYQTRQSDTSVFKKMNWNDRKIDNFFIADKIINENKSYNKWLSNQIMSIGDMGYRDVSTMAFQEPNFKFWGLEFLDSIFTFHNYISYFNDKFKIQFATQSNAYALGINKFNGKTYSECTDYWYYRLHVWLNRFLKKGIEINAFLKKQEGKYVFNLQPILTPNDNYNLFITQLQNIINSISVNKIASFDRNAYEQNNDKLYSIYFIDLNYPSKFKEYLVRNENTHLLIKNVISQLHLFSGGGQIFSDNLLQTNKGVIKTYLHGKQSKPTCNILEFSKQDYNAIVLNPKDQFTTVGVLSNGRVNVGLRFLTSMSAFLNEEEMSQLDKFIITSQN